MITGLQAAHALLDEGHDVVALYWSKTGEWWATDPHSETKQFAAGVPDDADQLQLALGPDGGFTRKKALRRSTVELDVVVNACHGGPGEDGTLQGLLDLAGIPYTGPSRAIAAMAMDKLAFGALMDSRGMPRLPRAAYIDTVDTPPEFDPPYIVKPRHGGSSIGTEVVHDVDALRALVEHGVHMRQGAVVEPYLADSIDLNIGIRRHPELQLSAIEKPLRGADTSQILGFEDKYSAGEGMAGAARELPADLPDAVADRLREHATVVGAQLPVRGVGRLDFLLHGDDLYVNELNTIPGSFARYLWIEPKVSFAQLLADMVDEARTSPTYRPVTEGADGAILRDAGSIASKLQ